MSMIGRHGLLVRQYSAPCVKRDAGGHGQEQLALPRLAPTDQRVEERQRDEPIAKDFAAG